MHPVSELHAYRSYPITFGRLHQNLITGYLVVQICKTENSCEVERGYDRICQWNTCKWSCLWRQIWIKRDDEITVKWYSSSVTGSNYLNFVSRTAGIKRWEIISASSFVVHNFLNPDESGGRFTDYIEKNERGIIVVRYLRSNRLQYRVSMTSKSHCIHFLPRQIAGEHTRLREFLATNLVRQVVKKRLFHSFSSYRSTCVHTPTRTQTPFILKMLICISLNTK